MKKLFENVSKNVFRLKEIDFNRDGDSQPDPSPDFNFDRSKENDIFKNVAKQISQLRMTPPPKDKELRKEKYLRIAANVSYDELDEMRKWIVEKLYADAVEFNKDDTVEDIEGEVKKIQPWEVLHTIDVMYTSSESGGLEQWKKDHNSPWEI